ncbi:MAG: hypothetical protein FWF78_02800, partial [Defluviitaleaceae bacterium]|nr:hypothetical protein [Defluviitaleaceae bacterium]
MKKITQLSFFVVKLIMRKKSQRGNHTSNRTPYQLMLPLELEVKIEASEAVRLMLEITERLDYN